MGEEKEQSAQTKACLCLLVWVGWSCWNLCYVQWSLERRQLPTAKCRSLSVFVESGDNHLQSQLKTPPSQTLPVLFQFGLGYLPLGLVNQYLESHYHLDMTLNSILMAKRQDDMACRIGFMVKVRKKVAHSCWLCQ